MGAIVAGLGRGVEVSLVLCDHFFPASLVYMMALEKAVDTTSKLALYQDCNTLVTRIEIRDGARKKKLFC
jgi:hypothetical protein